MALNAIQITGSNPQSNPNLADDPCYDLNYIPPHEHQFQNKPRWHPLKLIVVTVLATLVVLAGVFMSGFYYRGTLIQVSETRPVVEQQASLEPVQTLTLSEGESVITHLYERAGPAVVKIMVGQRGELDLSRPDVRGNSVGSGVVFDSRGYIVTNHHVVENARDVVVGLADGRFVKADVVGLDPGTDLAVLQIDLPEQSLIAAPFADSNRLNVGQFAVAIGHPFGLDKSLTVGHISGLGRMTPTRDKYSPVIEDMIQTDAAINPGNSGGPLFNLQGEVVGINTSIFSTSRGSQGVGFAVPSNTVQRVVTELLEKGYVSRPFLGVFGLPLNAERARILDLDDKVEHGLLIQEVFEDSPAWEAGLRAGDEVIQFGSIRVRTGGDILLAIDGQPVDDAETVSKVLKSHVIGDTITLTVFRAGEEIELAVTLSERPVPKS